MKREYWNTLVLLVVALVTVACSGIPRRERDQEQLEADPAQAR